MGFVLACTAAAVRIESAKTQLQELGASDERSSGMGDAAMRLLVELQTDVTDPINKVWGPTASWLFVVIFVKALYCTMQVNMNIVAGKTGAVVSLVIALSALIGCHMMLLPAAVATSRSVRLMGAVNEMRYIRGADGVKLAPDSLIIQAECLSTYVRETNGGQGMGLYLPLFGKMSVEKVTKVATTLSTTIVFLGQMLVPAEEIMLEHIQELKIMGDVHDYTTEQNYESLAKQLDLVQQQLASLQHSG